MTAMNLPSTLSAWPDFDDILVQAISGGLINESFTLGDPPIAVLQRQHPLFPAAVNEDIEAVTVHLARKEIPTPLLVRTGQGELCHVDEDDRCWRILTWIPGRSVDQIDDSAMAAQAGRIVARWHRGTADLDHSFHFARPGAHDTDAHMDALKDSLKEHAGHRLHSQVAALAQSLFEAWNQWDGRVDGPPRICHGDLKISNIRFSEQGKAICLLDLDTMAAQALDIELGDAARSWCNPLGEDSANNRFDSRIFQAAFEGYLHENPLPPEEREALPAGVERICLELAARFASDALNETYFGWNPNIAPGRGEHNLLRAQGQASLASSVHQQRSELEAILS
ncbi:MAG: phosphotransferase [Myxococcota bacterium]|nr:phosphotransferase [Myxococcota bacterium]